MPQVVCRSISVPVGVPQPFQVNTYPVNVNLIPGVGGTMLAEYTMSPPFGSAVTWKPWPKGAVSVPTDDEQKSAISALRFTATGAAGVAEVCA